MIDTPDLPFVSATFTEHLQQPTPKYLYHYTTQEGLLGIVASGSLWATDITYLNDAMEFGLPLGLIRERLSDELGDTTEIRRDIFTMAFECPLSICGRPLPGKGKRSDRCCAWSDAVICPAFDAAG